MVLVERVVTRGTVESAGALEYVPPSSTAGGSRLEVLFKPGDSVRAGDAVALVDGRPVILLVGDAQLGADIRPTSTGRDVERLQSGLRDVGFEIPDAETGSVGAGTQLAIAGLYQKAGFVADTTTESSGGLGGGAGGESLEAKMSRLRRAVNDAEVALRTAEMSAASVISPVSAAQATLETAKRKVTEAQTNRTVAVADALEALAAAQKAERDAGSATTTGLGGNGTGGGSQSPVETAEHALRDAQRQGDAAVADAQAQVITAQIAVGDAQKSADGATASASQQVATARSALEAAQEALSEAEGRDGLVVPRSEMLFVPRLPTTVLSVSATSSGGSGLGQQSSGPLFTLRSGAFVVNVAMPAGARLADGATGVAESDDGTVELEVSALNSSPTSGATAPVSGDPAVGGSPTSSGTSFDITKTVRGEATAGSNLRVTLSTPVTGSDEVLAVPLRAIGTDDHGRSFIQVANGSRFDRVEVRPGRSGSGMVELLAPDGSALAGVGVGAKVRVS